jgi:O-antigen ligase
MCYQSTGLRLEFLTNTLRLIKASPIVGYGTGSFRYIYNQRFPLVGPDNNQLSVHNPHNQYILTTVELGLIGLLVLLSMFIVMLSECRFLPTLEKHLAQGAIFTIMVGCLVNSWLMDFTSMHYFVYFLGICFAARPNKFKDIPDKLKSYVKY